MVHTFGKRVRCAGRLDIFPFNKFAVDDHSIIESYTVINNGVGGVRIGKRCTIGIGSVVIGPVDIEDDVIMAQHVVLSGLNHNYERIDVPISQQGVSTAPIVVGKGTWLAANVCVRSGVTIGQHCVIGAGAVVTKDIPSYSVAVGNPAKVVKTYDQVSGKWISAI